MTATAFTKILKQHGFKQHRQMPKGVRGFSYEGELNIWCEVYTDKPWTYLWITGNPAKDSRGYPGGRVIESEKELQEYLAPIRPEPKEAI